MIVTIHQPNFFPWFGYFLKIFNSEIFVFLDDVQIQKTGSSFTNRVAFCIQGNAQWFTVPIKRVSNTQNINETYFLNNDWKKKFTSSLQSNYSKAPFYNENIDIVSELVSYPTNNLSDFNINSIKKLTDYFEFKSSFINSSEYCVNEQSTKRLVEIIKKLGGTTYLSGTGADKYQDLNLYEQNNIKMIYNEFIHPVYSQVNTKSFIPNLSILDLLFNLGRVKLIETLNAKKLKKN
jgi:WbqC-like protein family